MTLGAGYKWYCATPGSEGKRHRKVTVYPVGPKGLVAPPLSHPSWSARIAAPAGHKSHSLWSVQRARLSRWLMVARSTVRTGLCSFRYGDIKSGRKPCRHGTSITLNEVRGSLEIFYSLFRAPVREVEHSEYCEAFPAVVDLAFVTIQNMEQQRRRP